MDGPNSLWGRLKNAIGWREGRTLGHIRSHSNLNPSSKKHKPSTLSLRSMHSDMAAIAVTQTPAGDVNLSTIPDPRSDDAPPTFPSAPVTPHHPDLSDEVAALSQKLVHAINLQTTLDDTLSQTRLNLAMANARIEELESTVAKQKETLESDVWIRKSSVEPEKELLRARIREIKKQRDSLDAEKQQIENELATLATEAIAEGQKMVVSEREQAKEREHQLQQKIVQLRDQVGNYEEMFKIQQEQLVGLRQTLDDMSQRDTRSSPDCPSSPVVSGGSKSGPDERSVTSDESVSSASVEPAAPLSLPHLIRPVLRDDVAAFEEFAELSRLSKTPAKRSSGGYSGFPSFGIGLGGNPYLLSGADSSTGSLTTPSSAATASSPQSPITPGSSVSSSSTAPAVHLRDTKLYKRLAGEDIYGTLQLSSIHWLSRARFSSAFSDGAIVIEPLDGSEGEVKGKQAQACYLCQRVEPKGRESNRTHQFGILTETARYLLCKHCLCRVRSTCELISFLGMVRDGHWKIENDNDLMAAWEECTRLREHMFWARIDGGVVPTSQHGQMQLGSRRESRDYSTRPPRKPREVETGEGEEAKKVDRQEAESKEQRCVAKDGAASPSPQQNRPAPGNPAMPFISVRDRSSSADESGTMNAAKPSSPFKRLSLNIPIKRSFFS